jgi:hypothetical protein
MLMENPLGNFIFSNGKLALIPVIAAEELSPMPSGFFLADCVQKIATNVRTSR